VQRPKLIDGHRCEMIHFHGRLRPRIVCALLGSHLARRLKNPCTETGQVLSRCRVEQVADFSPVPVSAACTVAPSSRAVWSKQLTMRASSLSRRELPADTRHALGRFGWQPCVAWIFAGGVSGLATATFEIFGFTQCVPLTCMPITVPRLGSSIGMIAVIGSKKIRSRLLRTRFPYGARSASDRAAIVVSFRHGGWVVSARWS
jgi:hypothetical protein